MRPMSRSPLHEVGEDPDPRLTFANERTFLAWNRTALALIGGGVAAAQLLRFDSAAIRIVVGIVPIALGAILAAVSYRRWEANERAMRLRQPLPSSAPPRWLSIALVGMALVLAVLVVVDAS
jgi:putative membrane protein